MRLAKVFLIVNALVVTEAYATLPGDLDNNGTVSIAEVQRVINAFLGMVTETPGIKTELVSRSTDGSVSGTAYNSEFPVISGDGRYAAFVSYAANLAAGATGQKRQILLHDRQAHTTELVSATSAGVEGNNDSFAPTISADGRYVAFESYATNLAGGDANGVRDVYLRDRLTQTTTRVSVAAGGAEANSESYQPSISGDGHYVAFTSYASNLTGGVSGTAKSSVYLRDLQAGSNTLVSVTTSGTSGTQSSSNPAISADGSRIAFWSYDQNLVAGDVGSAWDIFLWDRNATPNISLVSVSSNGVQKAASTLESMSRVVAPAISADGLIVAFSTTADNLVEGDTNGLQDVFVHHIPSGQTIRASESTDGVQATGGDSPVGQGERISLSSDGTWVAFTTAATNISAGGSNVMIHNNFTGQTLPITQSGTYASGAKGPAISSDGNLVVFMSGAQLDPSHASTGVFVHDRTVQ